MNFKKKISESIINWYHINKRDLPWRKTKNSYKIWVSEIILQQTKISQGINYYNEFISKFPNLESLAKSNDSEILKVWQGLGYYNRALNMLKNAKILCNEKKKFPKSYNELIKLKGIGEYTASAISSICNNEKKAVLDGNVYRVLSRVFNISKPINKLSAQKIFKQNAEELLPENNFGDYNQAIMDFGSIQCKPMNPKCNLCVIVKYCKSYELQNIRSRPRKIKNQKKIKLRHLNYLSICDKNYIYLQKRKNSDIWKNLYELPLIETNEITENELLKLSIQNKFKIKKISTPLLSKKIIHKLSHQKLNICFWKLEGKTVKFFNNKDFIRAHKSEIIKYPFPKPISKYLNEHIIK
tara:strand:- start:15 stop:1076 length:1062 start_codon:yes stop_codon:yes gene_type:complete